MLRCRKALSIFTLIAFVPLVAQAQPTNAEIYQDLARRCLTDVPAGVDSFRITGFEGMPYLRSGLVQAWRERGHTLFLTDSSGAHAPPLPSLSVAIEEASVAYDRLRGKRIRRTAHLALHHVLTGPDGLLLDERSCHETHTDTLRRADVARVETPGAPETQAERPEAGWVRRYLEPALLTAATAVTAYLFFYLRSEGSDDDP